MEGEREEPRPIGRAIAAGYVDAREIGRGGFATVYAARAESTGQVVALKVFNAPDATGRRVRRELLALERLAGIPHVVPVLGVTTSVDDRPVLVMPYLPETMSSRISDGGVEPAVALAWLENVGTAMDAAAARGVHHRDVKPGNVLIDDDGRAHLADFGISALGEMDTGTTTSMAFSPPYAAPERLESRTDIDPVRSDVYSLAATTWAAITGDAPFGTATTGGVSGLIVRVMGNQLVPAPGMPPALFDVLRKGMAFEPTQRFASGRDMADAARHALVDPDRTATRATPRAGSPPTLHTRIGEPTTGRHAEGVSPPQPRGAAHPDVDSADSSLARTAARRGPSPVPIRENAPAPSGATAQLGRSRKRRRGLITLGALALIVLVTGAAFALQPWRSTIPSPRQSNERVEVVPTLCTITDGRATLSPGIDWGASGAQTATLTASVRCGLADAESDLSPSTTAASLPPAPQSDPVSAPSPTVVAPTRWIDGDLEVAAHFDDLGFQGGLTTGGGTIRWSDDRPPTVLDAEVEVLPIQPVLDPTAASGTGAGTYQLGLDMDFGSGFGAPGTGATGPMPITASFDPRTQKVVAIEGVAGSFVWQHE